MSEALLFAYGTLRPGFDGEMARWLSSVARHVGAASARGMLYRIDYYPGFVPVGSGRVTGDLFLLPDAGAVLAVIDEHEECSSRFPQPHEYRRERMAVMGPWGSVDAWTYVYARDPAGLAVIQGGDFLAIE